MAVEYILTALTGLLAFTANFSVILLIWRLKRLDQDVEGLKKEMVEIRLNYLSRFDDVKRHASELHLQLTEKLIILETLLTEHLKTKRRKI